MPTTVVTASPCCSALPAQRRSDQLMASLAPARAEVEAGVVAKADQLRFFLNIFVLFMRVISYYLCFSFKINLVYQTTLMMCVIESVSADPRPWVWEWLEKHPTTIPGYVHWSYWGFTNHLMCCSRRRRTM